MKINAKYRHDTTFRVNNTIVRICKEKNLKITDILRSTLQFLFIIDSYCNEDINIICQNIIMEYQASEHATLSKEYTTVKTHITKTQYTSYGKITKSNAIFTINKLISIVINNDIYTNEIYNQSAQILKDPIININAIDFFLNASVAKKDIILLIESVISKLEYNIKYKNIAETYYKELYTKLFSKKESDDFINQYKINIFLLEEFKKIYFCMLNTYKIQLSEKSSKSQARKIVKKYKKIFKEEYDNNITKFVDNEINIFNNLNNFNQFSIFMNFLSALHSSKQEKTFLFALLNKIA